MQGFLYSYFESTQENVGLEAQVAELKDENRRLQRECEALASQKESLEQLLMTMAAETVIFILPNPIQ